MKKEERWKNKSNTIAHSSLKQCLRLSVAMKKVFIALQCPFREKRTAPVYIHWFGLGGGCVLHARGALFEMFVLSNRELGEE